MAREKISAAQQKAIDWIQGHSARELGALGTEVGKMLAELTAELMDAKAEAVHWKKAFDAASADLSVTVATVLAGGGERGASASGTPRLVIRKGDFAKAVGLQLFTEHPDEHTRIYELRPQTKGPTKVDEAVTRVIRPH